MAREGSQAISLAQALRTERLKTGAGRRPSVSAEERAQREVQRGTGA
jgi:hypothetical protein